MSCPKCGNMLNNDECYFCDNSKITQKCSGGNIKPPSSIKTIAEIDEDIDDGYRNRNWVFTVNNYTEEEYQEITQKLEYKYIVVGKECGKKNGTPHLQGYIEFKDAKTFKRMKKLLPRAWLGIRKGTPDQASDYCKKDCKFFEDGTLSKQGERKDLNEIRDKILNGSSVEQIAMEEPILYHKYGRTMNFIEDITISKHIRKFITKGIWYYGPAGCGKSTKWRLELYKNPDNYYVMNEDNGWWENYKMEEFCVLNDYTCENEKEFKFLLNLVSGDPKIAVKRRGRCPVPFMSKTVIITTVEHPSFYFSKFTNDLEQVYRRFDIINLGDESESDEDCEILP
jgi:hypothetical protein